MPRNDPRTRARGWVRRNTKIDPVLNIHVCHHEDRYSVEIQVRSLFQDRIASWVRIVNGVEKYVTETTETIEDEQHRALGKPIAEARPQVKSTITLTPVAVPPRERKWVDFNPGSYDHEFNVTPKAMIPRETDGAVKYEDIAEEFNKKKREKFDGASQWSFNNWISFLAKGGGAKKWFQYSVFGGVGPLGGRYRTKIPSFKISRRRRTSTSSARNRRISSLT